MLDSAITLTSFLLVAGGGAVGATARFAVGLAAARWTAAWPAGTLAVNLLGCLAAGLVVGLLTPTQEALRLFLLPGLLGGFTTFSAFGLETQQLLQRGAWGAAAGYAFLSVAAGVGAVAAGRAVAGRF
ncbi:MAG TPA: CrcB family protein [Planctomycetota bacterium]|nr:CrcB family protein [Planctomycetota bacterium]